MPVRNPPRPKVVAAGQSTVGAVILAYILRLLGVDVDHVPAEVLIGAAGAIATGAAYLKRDGLRGAWQRVVNGEPPLDGPAA
ncbi:MAG: hypothetical protein JWM31_23 [Solirubrobacterales bacterium]|nr:hypothetical protein [Solirubrobacterales bacterium]